MIIGVGLNKTGTTSLGYILKELGFNTREHYQNLTYKYRDTNNPNIIIDEARKYDAVYGMPWALVFKELDEAFPNSKFILTTRKDSETFYKSHIYHQVRPVSLKRKNNTARAFMVEYGCNPLFNKKKFIEIYEKHNNDVRKYFEGRKDFIEICWENGDSINKLSSFLDINIDIDLPHLKKASYDGYDRYVRMACKYPEKYIGMTKEEASNIYEF